ncbi:unnamed protein product [Allacma fusca]|uniref:Uncharacterized protein n=1 Tax=Allacma fusca TaxID=39272 RepID=A0A8J2KHD5_9HEXA|nr:unnamed protein product [Allacma fusca]
MVNYLISNERRRTWKAMSGINDRSNNSEEGESIPRQQRNQIWIGDRNGWLSASQSTVTLGVFNFAGSTELSEEGAGKRGFTLLTVTPLMNE